MRALIYDRYGSLDELHLADVASPTPGRGQVVVRVRRAALNPKDAIFRKGRFKLISRGPFPRRCGCDFAGVVEESRVAAFTPGQRVFGCLNEWRFQRGTLAELVLCDANELAPTPAQVDDDAAAGIALTGLTALQALRDVAQVRPGDKVLLNGASGGVGTAAIQLARRLGAEVHTLSSEANHRLCRELGADVTWSTASPGAWRTAAPFAVIFDIFGNLSFRDVAPTLTRSGRFVSTVPSPRRVLRDVVSRLLPMQERLVVVRPRTADLTELGALLAQGALRTVIDARYPLASFRDAFARLESKRARGKLVIEVA
jgi:NADPH:quinone reductase-like Zn-dependent oxidoreductase